MTEYHEYEPGHEPPALEDLKEFYDELNQLEPAPRSNTITPKTVHEALLAAHAQGLEPWSSDNGRWMGLQCPACRTLGRTGNATIEKLDAGPLKASCGTCHDDIEPGILALLGATKTNDTPTSLNGASPHREPTVLTWSEYRTKTPPDIEWLVRGLIPAHGFNVIGSTPKAGKTWFLSLLAISCATGKPFLGRFIVTEPVRVHFLALEGSAPALRHRIGCLARGMGIDPDDDLLGENLFIDYKPKGANLSEAPYAAWYCEEVQRIDARLCLIDTVRRAARIRESGAGVEDLQVLGENLSPLKNDRSVLFAHHARKLQTAQQGGTWSPPLERLSGSGDWGGLVEVGIVLDRKKGTEWRDTRFEIDGRDINSHAPMRILYEGEGSGPEGMLSYVDELTVRIEEADEETSDEGGTLKADEVSAWLAGRPKVQARASEIAEAFGVHKRTVQRAHGAFSKWGITWDNPDNGKSRSYWLNSPAYKPSRDTET